MERSDSNSVEEQLLILNKSLYCSDLKLSFRPWYLLIHESFTTREVSFEYNAEELGDILTLLSNFEESGTGIRHEVGLAAFGTAINDSAAPTYINLIFALSLMGDMPTNKPRTSDNAQQSSICPKSNYFLFCFILFFLFVLQAFFCSLANLRSTFFTSSAGGRFSGTIPRCTSISRTAALLAICSWLIRLSP